MYPFVAIDFETANENRSSACSIGMARFDRLGNVVETFHQLIHPHPDIDYFNPVNMWVHGITPEDVSDAPEWNEVFPAIQEFISSDPLVAHNMAFDGYVLSDLSDLYDLPAVTNRRFCTVRLARKILATELESKTLDQVFDYYFPQQTFIHHRADDDALACGMIFSRMLAEFGDEEIETLCPEVRRRRPRSSTPSILNQLESQELIQLYGKSTAFKDTHIVITGTLQHGKRAAIQELIAAIGGIPEKSLTKRTNVLVVGIPNPRSWAEGSSASRKLAKATKLRKSGSNIEVITEEEFFHRLQED